MMPHVLDHRLRCWPVLLALLGLLSACGGTPQTRAPTAVPAPTAGIEAATAASATTGVVTAAATPQVPTAIPAGEITVFAAASLTDAFDAIGDAFMEANPGTTVSFNYAGSNQLAEQINQGAPADVFASANRRQMEVAIEGGRISSGTERTFVRNRLVVIYPAENPAGLTTLQDLAKEGVKIVFAAQAVPVGQYSLDFLGKASRLPAYGASFSETVVANVVSYEENVRSVLAKVALGEADAGIVYSSDAASAGDKVGTIDIPDALNVIATYPIATLDDSSNKAAAEAFVAYILSPAAQTVLASYGFIPITGTATGEAPGAQPLEISGLVDTPVTLQLGDLMGKKMVGVQRSPNGRTLPLARL